jgi:hypothetical protein
VTFNENLVKRPQDLVPLLKFIQVSIFTNGIEMCLLKVGIGISLLRLRLSKTFNYAVYGCIVLSLLVNLIVFPGFFGQCRPMARLWDKTIPGTCWTPTYSLASSYVQTGNLRPQIPCFHCSPADQWQQLAISSRTSRLPLAHYTYELSSSILSSGVTIL